MIKKFAISKKSVLPHSDMVFTFYKHRRGKIETKNLKILGFRFQILGSSPRMTEETQMTKENREQNESLRGATATRQSQ